MTRKAFGLLILTGLLLVGCRKENVPQESYYFTFKVKIKNKINEPTIVNGFYGTLTDRHGKVKLKKDSAQSNITPIAQNEIYLFDIDNQEVIKETAIEMNGTEVYDLKKLKKAKVKPKFIIIPNKSGFFQFDTGDKAYIPLIRMKGNLGYYHDGLNPLPILNGELIKMDLTIDFKVK